MQGNKKGQALVARCFVKLGADHFRQPDVVFVRHERIAEDLRKIQEGADLVMEVVSPGEKNSERDWIEKRKVYAEAGIAEYWVVDPEQLVISVFALNETQTYRLAGEYRAGTAASILLPGFSVDVQATFAAGEVKGN